MATKRDKLILETIFNPFLTDINLDGDDSVETENADTLSDEHQIAHQLERNGIRLAESGDVKGAIGELNRAVAIAPDKASCYNNRAQALQLDGNIAEALDDLDQALSITNGKGELAGKIYCQRAIIYRVTGREEDSLSDFTEAAKLGNAFAKSHLAKMNPYAALCNQMLTEMMGNLTKGPSGQ